MKVRLSCMAVGFLSLVLSLAAQTSGSSPTSAQKPQLLPFSSVAEDEGGKAPVDTVLYNFSGAPRDGAESYSTPVYDLYGNLYGTTAFGGTGNCFNNAGCGTVFVLCAPKVPGNKDVLPCKPGNQHWQEHLLYSFTGGKDGAVPKSSLLFMGAGSRKPLTLYGTTYYGGQSKCNDGAGTGCGTVFELCAPSSSGGCGRGNAWTERVVHSFTAGRIDGAYPHAAVITDGLGNLYGTTVYGGGKGTCPISGTNNFCGTVFMLKGGAPWTFPEKVFHRFTGAILGCTPYMPVPAGCDGANPYAALCCTPSKLHQGFLYLYGTTVVGGDPNQQVGTVFEVKTVAPFVEKETYNFGANPDGANPYAGVIFGNNNRNNDSLYGNTVAGGKYNEGIAFELTPAGPPFLETVLYNFCPSGNCVDGANPIASFIWDANGSSLLGTTFQGGEGNGTVFELSPPGWRDFVLYDFVGAPDDGVNPWGGVMFDLPVSGQKELYGTTLTGGLNNLGIVYSVP
jgi:hypothetical protein